MKGAFYILIVVCVCATLYIGYMELTTHNHLSKPKFEVVDEMINHEEGRLAAICNAGSNTNIFNTTALWLGLI